MQRILMLKDKLRKKRIGSILISNLINIRYLTGFNGSSAFLLISKMGDFLFTDFRYKEQTRREVSNVEVIIIERDPVKFVIEYLKRLNIKRLAIEDTVTYRIFKRISTFFNLIPLKDTLENIRSIKEKNEIINIKKAVEKAEKAFNEVKGYIRKGNTEKSIALRLEESLKHNGVEKLPFDIIVASGKSSALPHARPTDKKIESGDLLIVDWGGEADGYFSDMTRTFLINGKDLNKKKEIYHIVLKANRRTVINIKKGLSIKQVDSFARETINTAGYSDYFGHGTGHGIGLCIHELPYISMNSKKHALFPNMVFTVEPGIYIPDMGGVRIEDMVVVTEKSSKTITTLPRKLEIL